jgi:hypothetical protein
MLLAQTGNATDDLYINNGTITFPPQIDATTVINNGTFSLLTLLPFDTSNTLNFTNTGTMTGSAGFRFDTSPNVGARRLAANFRNRVTGRITGLDGYLGVFTFVNGRVIAEDHDIPSYLFVSATNIVNEGILTAGASGTLQLVGTNVNLTRGGVQIQPIIPVGSVNGLNTNFFVPDVAIYDQYWGQANQDMNSANIVQSFGGLVVVQSPLSQVQGLNVVGNASFFLINPVGDFIEETIGFTNLTITNATGAPIVTNVPATNIIQAAFVGLSPASEFNVGIRFFPSSSAQNPFRTVSVGLTVESTNVVTATLEPSSLYLVDTLASETNRFLLTNAVSGNTYRPANYLLSRVEPLEFAAGGPGNAPFRSDILYQTDFATARVTNEYAAYSAIIENQTRRFTVISNADISLLPGRVKIVADNLDMTRARFRGEGIMEIQANHLVGSANAIVDGENLSYTLGSTNGNLNAVSLTKDSVARLKGTNYMWSGLWTNQWNMLIENYMQDPNDTNSYILSPVTNVVEVRIHALLLDAAELLSQLPVTVYDFVTHSTNVVANDRMTVVQSLFLDGQTFTLNGSITLSNRTFTSPSGNSVVIALNDWVSTNAPNLLHFTNNGVFTIPNEAHFGDDRPQPYTSFVNAGAINAGGQDIASSYFENRGTLSAGAGGLRVFAASGKMENGRINSTSDVELSGNVMKFGQATIQTGSRLDLMVTNSLFDSGGGSGNSIICRDGFRLLIKPLTGDLLGTTFQTAAPDFAAINHMWAGRDLGRVEAGFSNNVAIGRLVLTAGTLEDLFPPLFVFNGTGAGNALYVDFLDLSALADYQNEIQINPNLVIYYAGASLSFVPQGLQTPEEYLDGQFGNRLRWVSSFAGPNSSVDVLVNGNQTIKVNAALRNSKIIDSDGDGIPNYFDFTPFDGLLLTAMPAGPTPTGFRVSWKATPGVVYHVEYKSYLGAFWQPLTTVAFDSPTNGICSVVDTNTPVESGMRLYRVWYNPVP